jgi:hypothetical protein
MKPIERSEILGLADYEQIRDRFRVRVMAEKKRRRVILGPSVSAVFENRDTILLQIQEMLRTERITRSGAIDHEIETYNENLPGTDELSCTAMIEIANSAERDEFLRAAVGFEKHIWLVVDGERIQADEVGPGADDPLQTPAVHYLKFKLPPTVAAKLRDDAAIRQTRVTLETDHDAYRARAELGREIIAELGEDLRA